MKSHRPPRRYLTAALALLLGAAPVFACAQEVWLEPAPPLFLRPAARRGLLLVQNNGVRMAQNRVVRPGLQQWMERHKNLSPAEQQRELQNEPGFRQLTPQQQQRSLNELNRLQQMSPEQRNRRGALLQMTPVQREQFTASVQQYMALPPDRRMLVRRAFATLRTVPPRDRQAAMNTYPMMRQFSEYERQTLSNLLVWEPYFSTNGPGAGP